MELKHTMQMDYEGIIRRKGLKDKCSQTLLLIPTDILSYTYMYIQYIHTYKLTNAYTNK